MGHFLEILHVDLSTESLYNANGRWGVAQRPF
jgi:hypothetical protein